MRTTQWREGHRSYNQIVITGNRGEEGIALNVVMDLCDVDGIAFRKVDGLLVDLASSNDEDLLDEGFFCAVEGLQQGFIQRGTHNDIF